MAFLEVPFGRITTTMRGKLTRCIGLAAVKLWWDLRNLTFNLIRFVQHKYGLVNTT